MCAHDDSVEDHLLVLDAVTGRLVCVAHPPLPVPHDLDLP